MTGDTTSRSHSHGPAPAGPAVSRSSSSQSTSSQPASPPAGSAAIFGIAMLFNGATEAADKPRMLYFDANFWGGSATMTPVSARLRFYNGENISFTLYSEDPQPYIVFASVAQSQEGVETYYGGLWSEYDLIGDIHWIVPIPGHHGLVLPMMIVGGPATEIDTKAATFVISANQYTQMLHGIGNVRLKVQIADSPRYRNGKPLPFSDGSNASVAGTLIYVTRSQIPGTDDEKAELFHLDLKNVVYFPRSNSWKPDNAPGTPTPAKPMGRRRAFAQAAPTTPSPVAGGAGRSSTAQSRGGHGAQDAFEGVPIFQNTPQPSPAHVLRTSNAGVQLQGPGVMPSGLAQQASMTSPGGPDLKGKKRDRGDVDSDVEDNMDDEDNAHRNEHVGRGPILGGKFSTRGGRGGA